MLLAAAAAAGNGGEAWQRKVTVGKRERRIAESPQGLQAEALLFHFFPEISLKTTITSEHVQ